MANSYFDFKQFRVEQELCGMKVSTDACIQGALTAFFLKDKKPRHLLDIGVGTGLLSLMIAQELPQVEIVGIDVDAGAVAQASANFKMAPFKNAVEIIQHDIFKWSDERQFDAIISNPPFFKNHLQANELQRNTARHELGFTKEALAQQMCQRLSDEGFVSILYPTTEWKEWMDVSSKNGLYPCLIFSICPNEKKGPNRMIGFFSKKSTVALKEERLVIYQAPQVYTAAFVELMQGYYASL